MMTPADNRPLLDHVLLPVANQADATGSAQALAAYDPGRVTALHVAEQAGGAPDKTSPARSREVGEEAFEAVRDVFPAAEDRLVAGDDVVDTILDVASELDATAIVFRPRGGSRLTQFLAGDHAVKLVTRADRPVVALPFEEPDE